MTVRPVRRREMGEEIPPKQIPSNDAPMPPFGNRKMQEQEPPLGQDPMMAPMPAPNDDQNIADHTHPEYDQMMVKLQEIEGMLSDMQMGGIDQKESMDDSDEPEDKEKPSGDKFPISKEALRKIIREELQGIPERDVTKKQVNPDAAVQDIPQTNQPANGEAPSGGGFDSDDKTNKDDGDATVSQTPKPASEFPKTAIQKNKYALAKKYIERAKKLMKEAEGEDPTEPQPGKVEKKPVQMDGMVANNSPAGGTEGLEIEVEDEDEEEEDKKSGMMQERTSRRSLVGSSGSSAQEEILDIRARASESVREYLQKAGHGRALNMMQKPTIY